jgi:hypothetical protein
MRQSLAAQGYGSEVRANGCSLDEVITPETTRSGTTHYDLGDIDPRTIKVEPIGNLFAVAFSTTNYHKSIRNTVSTQGHDYNSTSDRGIFLLDTRENAESFGKALSHAVELCGGKPSTF